VAEPATDVVELLDDLLENHGSPVRWFAAAGRGAVAHEVDVDRPHTPLTDPVE
jgi:hypothetical protein